jgi:hypothetical protein
MHEGVKPMSDAAGSALWMPRRFVGGSPSPASGAGAPRPPKGRAAERASLVATGTAIEVLG